MDTARYAIYQSSLKAVGIERLPKSETLNLVGPFRRKPCLSEMDSEYLLFLQLNTFFPCSCCFSWCSWSHDALFSHKFPYYHGLHKLWQQPVVPIDIRTLLSQELEKIYILPCFHELWQAILSPIHSSLIFYLSCSLATGRPWVLPQVSVLILTGKNVV